MRTAAPRFREEPDNLNYVPLAPTLTSIGGLTVRTKSWLNASLRCRYIGDRPANEDNSVTAEGYFLMDAVIRWERSKYEINLSIENIFDVEWNEAQFDTTSRLAAEAEPYQSYTIHPVIPRGSGSLLDMNFSPLHI